MRNKQTPPSEAWSTHQHGARAGVLPAVGKFPSWLKNIHKGKICSILFCSVLLLLCCFLFRIISYRLGSYHIVSLWMCALFSKTKINVLECSRRAEGDVSRVLYGIVWKLLSENIIYILFTCWLKCPTIVVLIIIILIYFLS